MFSLEDMSPVEHEYSLLTASEQHSCHIHDNILKLFFFIDGLYDPCFILPNVFSASRCPAEGHAVMAIIKNLSLNDHPDDKLV